MLHLVPRCPVICLASSSISDLMVSSNSLSTFRSRSSLKHTSVLSLRSPKYSYTARSSETPTVVFRYTDFILSVISLILYWFYFAVIQRDPSLSSN